MFCLITKCILKNETYVYLCIYLSIYLSMYLLSNKESYPQNVGVHKYKQLPKQQQQQ